MEQQIPRLFRQDYLQLVDEVEGRTLTAPGSVAALWELFSLAAEAGDFWGRLMLSGLRGYPRIPISPFV